MDWARFVLSLCLWCFVGALRVPSLESEVTIDEDLPFTLTKKEALDLVREGYEKHANIIEKELKFQEKSKLITEEVRHHRHQPSPDSIRQSLCIASPMLEVSKLIVEKFNVSPEDAPKVLSKIRFSDNVCETESARTLDDCEIETARQTCSSTAPYRTIDGTCNNLVQPTWGAARRPFKRHLTPAYGNGVNTPRGQGSAVLPLPRLVSAAMSENLPSTKSPSVSLMLMQWGQFLDHDLTLTPEATLAGGGRVSCCENGFFGSSSSSDCIPIEVIGDTFYNQFGIQCFRFVRSLPTSINCNCGHREQQNDVTNYLDASNVYGSDSTKAASLRLFKWGLMKNFGTSETGTCPVPNSQTTCPLEFLPRASNCSTSLCLNAGDGRVTEQPGLTSMHTLWLRVHNNIALQLLFYNPTWTDERIYQETRRIVGALNQHITYKEFLPIVVGNYTMTYFNLWLLNSGYQNNYSNQINPTTPNAFAAAAFRFGHSLIPNTLQGSGVTLSLSRSFDQPTITQQSGTFPSQLLRGLAASAAEHQDHVVVDAVRNLLFARAPNFNVGFDLLSLNIMRGRDHGLPPYVSFRQLCGLPVITSFDQLYGVMPNVIVNRFRLIYASVADIDLFAGGLSEYGSSNGILGPTFSCILGDHFRNLKFGDRFWYEGNFQPKPFTTQQLVAIRETSLASLLCQFTSITSIQRRAMLRTSVAGNGLLACSNYPRFKTQYWKV